MVRKPSLIQTHYLFAVMTHGSFFSKAKEAISGVFRQHKGVCLAKVQAKAIEMCKKMNLNKVVKDIKNRGKSLDVFFSAKTHKNNGPFRVIVSEKGTWQKEIAAYLLKSLTLLDIHDPLLKNPI